MATISVTKTGTLNPAAGRIDYDDATNVGYVVGDDFTLSAGITLRIQSSTTSRAIGNVTFGLNARLEVSNSSTTTPIVVQSSAETKDYVATDAATFQVRGLWNVIATGTGASGQTLDFSSLLGGVIDRPPVVLVETGNGTNVFVPFFNIGASGDATALTLAMFAGDIKHGCVFSFNSTTRVATFGDGTNGAVIPSGAKVKYPNIHFTSAVFAATVANRCELGMRAGSTLDCEGCAFSLAYTTVGVGGSFATGVHRHVGVAFAGQLLFNSVGRQIDINGLYVSPDPSIAAPPYGVSLTGSAQISVNNLYAMLVSNGSTNGAIYLSVLRKLVALSGLYGWSRNSASANRATVQITSCTPAGADPIEITGVQGIGGSIAVASSQYVNLTNVAHSDQVLGLAGKTSSLATFGMQITGSVNCVMRNVTMVSGGAAPNGHPFYIDPGSKNCVIHTVTYDGQSNAQTPGNIQGAGSYYTNIAIANARAGLPNSGSVPPIRFSNVTGTSVNPSSPQGGQLSFVQAATPAMAFTGANGWADISPHNLFVASGGASGSYGIGPATPNASLANVTVVSGVAGTDFQFGTSGLTLPGACQLVLASRWPVRAITSFTGAAIASSYGGTGLAVEHRFRRPNGAWTAWFDATSASAYQTALTSLTGYTSSEGFEAETRITTTGSASGRTFSYLRVPANTDSAFSAPEIGFVDVAVTNMAAGSTVALYETTPSLKLVKVLTVAGTSQTLDYPYNFDGAYKPLRVVVRKAGYGEVVVNSSTHQMGTSVPAGQVQAVAVNESTAATLTGIAINGAAGTITVSQARTLAEVYAYAQWWAAQPANIGYAVPVTTADGTTYSSGYDWTINGAALSGAGKTLSMPAKTLTLASGGDTDAVVVSVAGRRVKVKAPNLIAGTRVALYDRTSNTLLDNVVIGSGGYSLAVNYTADLTLELRAGYQSGTTAKLPIRATGVLTSAGATFLDSQVADTIYQANGIDGSTCTEFIPDFPNLQIDVSSLSGVTTVQRIYAWVVWAQAQPTGIQLLFGGVTAMHSASYRIDQSIVDARFDNVLTTPVLVNGGRIYRADGTTVIATGSGPIQIDPNEVYVAGLTNPIVLSPGERLVTTSNGGFYAHA